MKKVLRINNSGLFIEDILLNDDDIIPVGCIETPCPDGFYKPKWDGNEWVEGMTADEIAAIPPSPPSEMDAVMTIAVDHEYRLTLLELGVN